MSRLNIVFIISVCHHYSLTCSSIYRQITYEMKRAQVKTQSESFIAKAVYQKCVHETVSDMVRGTAMGHIIWARSRVTLI